MLAYVDDCLPPRDRAALEERMIEHPEIKSQIEAWLSQNQAIRAAFSADPPFRLASTADDGPAAGSLGRRPAQTRRAAGQEGGALDRRAVTVGLPGGSRRGPGAAPNAPARKAGPKRNARAFARRVLRVLAAALVLWAAGAVVSDHHGEAARAAAVAYRTFAGNGTRPVEIATSDSGALNQWLASQIAGAAHVPDLTAAGVVLIGGRIVPGAAAPAEFLLYENRRRERIAIEIEAVDSPPETAVADHESGDVHCASWTGAGHSFAIVGRGPAERLAELARLVRDGWSKH
jgi:anti-sigma factor RsiW